MNIKSSLALPGFSMNEPRNGPEFAPIRDYIKSFKIKVTVFDKNDEVVRTEIMDYGKPEDRVWLGRLSFWSWQNSHYVETEALKE